MKDQQCSHPDKESRRGGNAQISAAGPGTCLSLDKESDKKQKTLERVCGPNVPFVGSNYVWANQKPG